MTDQPAPTEHEEERAPEEMGEQEAMQYPGHEDPDPQRPGGESGSADDDPAAPPEPENPPDDAEIHDA